MADTALIVRDAASGPEVRCAGCEHRLGGAGEPWKPGAHVEEGPMRGAAGESYAAGEQVLLRRFFCPGCGALLDTETALPGDPFLNDIVTG